MRAAFLIAAAVALSSLQIACDNCDVDYVEVDGTCVPRVRPGDAGVRADVGGRRDGDINVFDGGQVDDAGPDAGFYDSGNPDDPSVTLGTPGHILLKGTAVLTMTGQAPAAGEVYVENGSIACVAGPGGCAAQSAGATVVDTKAVILPGLVDAHNHVAYNYLPEWVTGIPWDDHDQWAASPEYDAFLAEHDANKGTAASLCAMVQWGEMRAALNGTTTMYGAQQARTCFRWLVRNAALSTGYNGWSSNRIRSNVLGVDQLDATSAAALIDDMNTGSVGAYLIHVAEGISTRAHNEFVDLAGFNLLRSETIIIHGTALTPADFAQVAAGGTKLVWSPSSNLALYGFTTDVASALGAGVSVSLAPDWTPSGADDQLHEMRLAKSFAQATWPGLLSDQDLVEMSTNIPASQMTVPENVGTLQVGRYADILVLTVDPASPFTGVVEARPQDIRMVMIGGVPTFGDPALLIPMNETPMPCDQIMACGRNKVACFEPTPDGPVTIEGVRNVITGFYPNGPQDLFDCN